MKTHTLLDLCRAYAKVEIPIIQRNYIQGSDTRVRTNFVKHLVDALKDGTALELDFVYGGERGEGEAGKVFIPLDGQQRLTTLWLLHAYLMLKDQVQSEELQTLLARFVYETRPNAKDFCRLLLKELNGELTTDKRDKLLTQPKDYLCNRAWFDTEWLKDATVVAMLEMLEGLARHYEELEKVPFSVLDGGRLISFYYLPLEKFGLTNDLYIRMNARGEQLTDFEHFKSSLYKILQGYTDLDKLKRKMEYDWVDNLWPYREGKYVVDEPFMKLLSFITEINDIERYRSSSKSDSEYVTPKSLVERQDPYTEIGFISEIYKQHSYVGRLVYALDALPELRKIDMPQIYRQDSFSELLKNMLSKGFSTTDERILMYTAIEYIRHYGSAEKVEPLLRVVRNLSLNTDKQNRDLPRIYATLDKLVRHEDIYAYLTDKPERLEGFSPSQQVEEEWKAWLRKARPEVSELLDKLENYFGGRVESLLCVLMDVEQLNEAKPENLNLEELSQVFEIYEQQYEKDKFVEIWGDLLMRDLYDYDNWSSRYTYQNGWKTARGLFHFLLDYTRSRLSLEEYCLHYEREQIKILWQKVDGKLGELRQPGEQLFVYYVITRRLMKKGVNAFFANGYNFGWLRREKGYKSLFDTGIEACQWFSSAAPIYQSYGSQFRYNMGLRDTAALPPEKVGTGRLHKPFERLMDWVNQD